MSGNPYTDSQHLRSAMADRCGRVTGLSFSRGKDSIASWLVLRDEGWDVRPFSYTWIPGGLRVENESLAYYERAFGCPILRLTHPMFYDLIDNGVYQHPGRWAVLDEIGVPQVGYDALNEMAREELGVEWLAMGTRAVDSHRRRIAIERHGPVSEVRRTWQPIYDMRMAEMQDLIRAQQGRVLLPPDYRIWGRSFDGLYWRFLDGLRTHYPDDYERVLEWFPLAWTQFRRPS